MPLTVTVEPESYPPRVKVYSTSGNHVARTGPDGVAVTLRGSAEGVTQTLYDYEAPQEVALTYTDGVHEPVVVSMPDVGNWLVHLTKPELSMPLEVESDDAIESGSTVRTLPLIGRAPHTVATGRFDFTSGLRVHTFTLEEVESLWALLQDESVLWLSTHGSHGWGPFYVRVLNVSTSRFMGWCENPRRVVTLPFLVQDRPLVSDADLTPWERMPSSWAGMPTSWAEMPG